LQVGAEGQVAGVARQREARGDADGTVVGVYGTRAESVWGSRAGIAGDDRADEVDEHAGPGRLRDDTAAGGHAGGVVCDCAVLDHERRTAGAAVLHSAAVAPRNVAADGTVADHE